MIRGTIGHLKLYLGLTLMVGLGACTLATPDAVLDPQRKAQTDQWLTDFTNTDAKGFFPVVTQSGKQCSPETLKGFWNRQFSSAVRSSGSAIWTFNGTGDISCRGSQCEGQNGTPRRYAMREVHKNTQDRNVGLFVIFSSNAIMRTTCEVDGNKLYFGKDLASGMEFSKLAQVGG